MEALQRCPNDGQLWLHAAALHASHADGKRWAAAASRVLAGERANSRRGGLEFSVGQLKRAREATAASPN
jgi:hypothetical protein